MESTNLSSKKRKIMLEYLEKIRTELSNDPINSKIINDIEKEIEEKKYGLIWEEHEEKVDEDLKTKIPVFKEFEDKQLLYDESKKYNFILEGDNLHSLYLLNKTHHNKIDIICIDPPYNTGNEDFIYGDDYVEDDDLFKHSKWLSFMNRRLNLAKNLLTDKGILFININDNEQAQLRLLCNEIFGEENFVATLHWKKKKQPSYLHGQVAGVMEYILVYSKDRNLLGKLSLSSPTDSNTRVDNATNQISERVIKSGIRVKVDSKITLIKKGVYKNKTMETEFLEDVFIKDGRTCNEFKARAKFRDSQERIDMFCDEDVLFITKNFGFRRDKLQEELEKKKAITDLLLDWGDNQDSDKEIREIFGEKKFDYPKPTLLIKNLLKSTNYEDCIILDFFAGSGTTGQAVLELNKEDEGNRNFILCTNNEIKPRRKLDYIHDKGYMLDYNPSEIVKEKNIKKKIEKFLNDNPNINEEIFLKTTEYEEYGICRSITYPRIKTVITGKKQNGEIYSNFTGQNLKYYKTEYIDRYSEDTYISNELEKFIIELVQLENGIDEKNDTIQIIFDYVELDDFFHSDKLEKCKILYKDRNVLLSSKQMEILYKYKIKYIDIPEYYYKNEIMEVNEW